MKDAKGHGSNARSGGISAVRLDSTESPARKTGYLATPQPKYAVNQTVARSAEGGSLSTAAAERIDPMSFMMYHPVRCEFSNFGLLRG